LLASRRARDALAHGAAFVVTVALVYVPFLAWNADHVLAAYHRQSGRKITAESLWYLLLHPFGLARLRTHISFSAGAPGWANALAVGLQALLVVAVVAATALVRGRRPAAVAIAGLAPAVFLLANRIFSPQFVVLLLVTWAIAGALVLETRRAQLWLGVLVCAATLGNLFVFPYALPHYAVTWQLASATLFACGLAATAWLLLRALAPGQAERPGAAAPG
jgi:hypothetical protein